ncbi:MAG TPA: hypothetical protein VG755_22560 [Nannocystaceae bacterium]|nr:hypothetical protein [Nannocystaceae bacterium]
MRALRKWSPCLVALIASCTAEHVREGAGGGSGIPSTSAPGGDGSEGDDDSEEVGGSGADEASDDEDGAPQFDVGDGVSGGDGGSEGSDADGCKAVDFLFVIDNSASMENEQAALVAAFPMFMEAIVAALEQDDYHVLVTDTDAWGRCNTANPWNGNDPGSDLCTSYVKTTVFEECDRVRGAGVLNPAGKFATNGVCDPSGDQRYIVEGEPDLAGTFSCMATVGTAGDAAEKPMESLVAAVAPEINTVGGCNEGFLRDDAVLVVTFISDDPNHEDSGTPKEWYDAVVAAKGGDPSAVVVLGFTPHWDDCRPEDNDDKGIEWQQFVELWGDHGLHGNVCSTAEEYASFFQQAVSVIDGACDEFEPPG